MINSGRHAAPEVVRRLLALEEIELTVGVGRDPEDAGDGGAAGRRV